MSLRVPSIVAASCVLSLGMGASLLNAEAETRSTERRGAAHWAEADSAARRASTIALSEVVRVNEQALGRSGALRLAVVGVMERVDLSVLQPMPVAEDVTYRWNPVYGTPPEPIGGEARLVDEIRAPTAPGYWRLQVRRGDEQHEVDGVTIVTKVPFSQKRNGRLNGYLIGTYATEGSGRVDRYAPPAGFIEITPETREVHVSKHLRLGQFVTKDQFAVWPKYVALDLNLIDKLELVMQELHAMGVRADRMHIMSGFRTPNYNGPGEGGRALLSRHTYGDAADIWIENGSRTGYIADLNGDGHQDIRDAEVIVQAVERVEQKYPELVGGVGLYRDSGARGPFVHVDVRGVRSRW